MDRKRKGGGRSNTGIMMKNETGTPARKKIRIGDVVAQLWGCGGSVVGMWWLSFGDVVAQL
jgi:hypothetical protein